MIAYPVYNDAQSKPLGFAEDSVLTKEVIPAFCLSCLTGVLLKRTILVKPE
jgi:hypothetical protein